MRLILREEAYAIIGACFEVYNEMGHGFLEAVYQQALELELAERAIPFVSKPKMVVRYKGMLLSAHYEPDLLVYEKVVVELKANKALDDVHRSQVHNYLKANGLQLGLLVNFGKAPDLEWERIVRTDRSNSLDSQDSRSTKDA